MYAGEKIGFMVSTETPAPFTIDLYRSGYYGGTGGRHMLQLGPFEGVCATYAVDGDGAGPRMRVEAACRTHDSEGLAERRLSWEALTREAAGAELCHFYREGEASRRFPFPMQ